MPFLTPTARSLRNADNLRSNNRARTRRVGD